MDLFLKIDLLILLFLNLYNTGFFMSHKTNKNQEELDHIKTVNRS